jgi:hypothetical protein
MICGSNIPSISKTTSTTTIKTESTLIPITPNNPGTPSTPANQPINAFANVDPRIPQILLSLFPSQFTSPSSAAVSQSVRISNISIRSI